MKADKLSGDMIADELSFCVGGKEKVFEGLSARHHIVVEQNKIEMEVGVEAYSFFIICHLQNAPYHRRH